MYNSKCELIGDVSFPEFTGEKVYMQKFYQKEGLPENLKRWQPTIDQMLATTETDQPIFLMISQKLVNANESHRPSGVHIDGYWDEKIFMHRSGNGHKGHNLPNVDLWSHIDLSEPESLILASNYASCRAFTGDYSGVIGERGDCSTIDTTGMSTAILEPFKAYKGNVAFLHESLPVDQDVYRTLVRLNLKGQ